MARDNFTARTKDILGKRVGFKCSNPDCRKPTIGPHSTLDKVLIIGVASHITAAAAGGPRYDASLEEEQRISTSNGIWLCSNCASLIDKDEMRFPTELLNKWKIDSEQQSFNELQTLTIITTSPINSIPYLEMDLIWSGSGKYNYGLSEKNREVFRGPINIVDAIWNNQLFWKFNLALYNNSSYPAFNVKIIEDGNFPMFSVLDNIPKINNIPPYGSIELNAKFIKDFVGTGQESLNQIEFKFPPEFENKELDIEYEDENRKKHITNVILTSGGSRNSKVQVT